jgi:hypothetical protein
MHQKPHDLVHHKTASDAMIRPLAWVWMGIVIGVSFLATPIKFTADSLTRPVALDVGRATFNALGYLELALTVTLAALIWRAIATHPRTSTRSTESPKSPRSPHSASSAPGPPPHPQSKGVTSPPLRSMREPGATRQTVGDSSQLVEVVGSVDN